MEIRFGYKGSVWSCEKSWSRYSINLVSHDKKKKEKKKKRKKEGLCLPLNFEKDLIATLKSVCKIVTFTWAWTPISDIVVK